MEMELELASSKAVGQSAAIGKLGSTDPQQRPWTCLTCRVSDAVCLLAQILQKRRRRSNVPASMDWEKIEEDRWGP